MRLMQLLSVEGILTAVVSDPLITASVSDHIANSALI